MRSGQLGDFIIDTGRGYRERRGLGGDIANLLQEGAIGVGVEGMRAVPGIDPRLDVIAPGQQFGVAGGKSRHQIAEARPKGIGRQARSGRGFTVDKVVQRFGDRQAGNGDVGHGVSLGDARRLRPGCQVVNFSENYFRF